MSTTPGLSVTELVDNADGNEAVVNEGFRRLEVFAGGFIIDRDLTVAPASPTDGDAYIVGASATGTWATHDDDIAWDQAGTWKYQTPTEGMRVYLVDEDAFAVWDGSSWMLPDSLSTTEVWTGKTWIDGKKIYRKVIDCGNLPSTATTTTAHGLTGISTWMTPKGVASNGTNNLPIPYSSSTLAANILLYTNGTNVVITTGQAWVTYQTYAILEYTKT